MTRKLVNRLVFLDVRLGLILSSTTEGTDVETLVQGLDAFPDGVQVDEENGHIYWTNMGQVDSTERSDNDDGFIQRCNLDGSNVTTVVPPGVTRTPKQLQLDRRNGRLYWCDREGMCVMRCNLDGSQPEILVNNRASASGEQSDMCVGIAIDVTRGLLYWTQKGSHKGGQGRIFRAGIDIPVGETAQSRKDVEVLYQNMPEPIDLELDDDQQILYWTDRGVPPFGNTLNRASVSFPFSAANIPSVASPDTVISSGFGEAIGLALDLPGNRVFVTDLEGNLRSSALDGSDPKVLLEHAGTFTGIVHYKSAEA